MKNVFELYNSGELLPIIDSHILSAGLRIHIIVKRIKETEWEIGIKIKGQ